MEALLALPRVLPWQCQANSISVQPQQEQQKRWRSCPSLPSSSASVSAYLMAPPTPDLCRMVCVAALAAAFLDFSENLPAHALDTPYSQSQTQKMQMGLLNGKIRPCPSNINPNCISTSSMNATFAIPWIIPPEGPESAARKLLNAIQATQRNSKIIKMEDTPTGQFLQVEVDGIFGRDIMEFLVKSDVVTYRSLAEKVLYVYPFTTPISDFGAQEKRIKALEEELGWSVPTWDSTY